MDRPTEASQPISPSARGASSPWRRARALPEALRERRVGAEFACEARDEALHLRAMLRPLAELRRGAQHAQACDWKALGRGDLQRAPEPASDLRQPLAGVGDPGEELRRERLVGALAG